MKSISFENFDIFLKAKSISYLLHAAFPNSVLEGLTEDKIETFSIMSIIHSSPYLSEC